MNPYDQNPARAPLLVEWVPPARSEVQRVERALLGNLQRPTRAAVPKKKEEVARRRLTWLE